ncbi:MAG: two-component sensor histidine kinase [Burkholderiales bacterium]|nr:two-component sensor histidine kinase [Burkholderiales bacterium]
MTSIRRHLLTWLLTGLLAAVAAAAVLVYDHAREDADQIFDYQMERIAIALPTQAFAKRMLPLGEDPSEELVIQVWSSDGEHLYLSHTRVRLPRNPELGFTTVNVGREQWRVLSAQVRGELVQVAQPMRVRSALAREMALRAVAPLLALIPILTLGVLIEVARGLRPLRRVADEVARRTPTSLAPIAAANAPVEVQPLVTELNALLERLGHALDAQRAFVADAAHELRTPLAALQLQIRLAERAKNDEERAAEFDRVRAGLARATRLVDQLLTLARQEPEEPGRAPEPVDLLEVARAVAREVGPLAGDKGVDLGVIGEQAVTVRGDADALRVMLTNLVDNAVRYTPGGGRIDVEVAVEDDASVLRVRDTGPGIPPNDRERVFDRFFRSTASRGTGSGLGLAIVRRVAERHGASISLTDASPAGGLLVTIRFPRDATASLSLR